MSKYVSPFNLPDEHMRIVGIIAAHWECLDFMLQRAVAFVSMHDFYRVHLLTDNIGFRTKVDLLMAYARPFQDAEPDIWKEFTRAFDAVKTAYACRNAYVHAKWSVGQSPDLPTRNVARINGGKLVILSEPTPLSELEKAAQLIFDAGEQFVTLFQKMGMKTPSPEKP